MTKRMKRGRPSGRPRFAVLAGAAFASAAIAVGCGGGDGDDSTSSDARDEYILQADQICTDSGERVDAKQQKLLGTSGAADDQQVITLFKQVTIPELQKMFDRIGELTPPPGDEDQVDEILDAADEALSESKDRPATVAKPIGQGNPFDETNALLQEYGFEVCGGGNA